MLQSHHSQRDRAQIHVKAAMLYTAVSIFWVFYQPAVLETTSLPPWKHAEWMNYWRRKETWMFAQQKGHMCMLAASLGFRVLCLSDGSAQGQLRPTSLTSSGPEPVCSIPVGYRYITTPCRGLLVLTLIQLCVLPTQHHWHCFCTLLKSLQRQLTVHIQFIHSMMHTLCYLYKAVKSSEIKHCLMRYYLKNLTQKTLKTDNICVPILECVHCLLKWEFRNQATAMLLN